MNYVGALPKGTDIGGYSVVSVLGDGGFGVTYKAENLLEGLEEQVAIKEYMPIQFAVRDGVEVHPRHGGSMEDFEWGREQFLKEARMLASFKHPNIVKVKQFFRGNNTAYIVMEYEDGEPLDELLDRHGTLSEAQLKRILFPIADGLCEVHRQGVWHRDIKPANVFVRRSDESPVLLDFGAARNALGVKSKSMEAIVSPPYSPPEQYYSEGQLGSYTDIYALSALCYRAVTGESPVESPQRERRVHKGHTDPLRTLAEKPPKGYSRAMLAAVDWGLRLNEEERPQSVEEWLAAMEEQESVSVRPPSRGSAVPTNEKAREEPDEKKSGTEAKPDERAEEARHGEPSVQPKSRPQGISSVWVANIIATLLGLSAVLVTLFMFIRGEDSVSPALVGSFTVANRSTHEIVVVRAAPVALGNYGDNKLGTATISPSREHRVLLEEYRYGGACEFDVFIKTEDQQIYEEKKKDLCRNNEIVFVGDGTEPPVADPPVQDEGSVTPAAPNVAAAPPPVVECATCQPLTVRTGPSDARVQITNIRPRYEPGIKLPPDSYDIRVTADGFDTVTRTLRHGDEPTDEWVGLPFRDCPVCPTMIELPTGEYEMGTGQGPERYPNEGPPHRVAILYPFAVGAFEVSFEEWDACVADRGCTRRLRDEGRGRGKLPAVHVTVADAKEYVNWLKERTGRRYRLPSEAEWEYAARAGTPTERHWGTRLEDQCAYENGADITAQQEFDDRAIVGLSDAATELFETARETVGCTDGYVYAAPSDEDRFRPNPWGLHHMLGNVSEWTADCWHRSYLIRPDGRELRAPTDGSAWTRNCGPEPVRHVSRGGAWSSMPRSVRAPIRFNEDPAMSANNQGFRVAVEITR